MTRTRNLPTGRMNTGRFPVFTLLFAVLFAAFAGVHAQDATGTDSTTDTETPLPDLDRAGPLPASQFLAKDKLEGPNHKVNPEVAADGVNLTYAIESPFGFFPAQGTELAVERIHETDVIAKLKEVSKSDVFVDALKKAGASKLKTVGNLIEDPGGTLSQIPKGASRFFNRLGESLSGQKSETESAGYKNVLGASTAERQIAARLRFDPYTSNEALRKELEKVAWAAAAGGLTLNVAGAALDGGVGMVVSGISVTGSLQAMLVEKSPSELRLVNRAALQSVAVSPPLIEQFLDHPHISPTHETFITQGIASIGKVKGNDLFFKNAITSWNEIDARFFMFSARIMHGYNGEIAPIKEFRDAEGLTIGLDANGILLVAISADYAMWTERTATRVEAFQKSVRQEEDIEGVTLWITGDASPRFLEEMKSRSIPVQTRALEKLNKLGAKRQQK